MTTDVVLDISNGYYDITFNDEGDINTAEHLDTAILMSIFGEARATESEIPQAQLRRGWIGNESTPGFDYGSKAWQFEQERLTATNLADLGPIVHNSLQWLVTDQIAERVEVENPFIRSGKVCIRINLYRDGSQVDSRFYELWENTGNF